MFHSNKDIELLNKDIYNNYGKDCLVNMTLKERYRKYCMSHPRT